MCEESIDDGQDRRVECKQKQIKQMGQYAREEEVAERAPLIESLTHAALKGFEYSIE